MPERHKVWEDEAPYSGVRQGTKSDKVVTSSIDKIREICYTVLYFGKEKIPMAEKILSYFGTYTQAADGAAASFKVEYLTSLGIAALVIFLGHALVSHSKLLKKFAIPAPVVSGLLIIYFCIRRGMADEMDQKKWNNRIVVAVVSCIGAVLGSATLTLILGYYQ